MLTLRAIPFPIWNQKRGPFFHLKIGVSFCCFSLVAIALFAPEGLVIFIRISNSGRPTVLTVGSWFVLSCVCLMASMARSVNCLGRKKAVQVHLIGAKPIVQVKR